MHKTYSVIMLIIIIPSETATEPIVVTIVQNTLVCMPDLAPFK